MAVFLPPPVFGSRAPVDDLDFDPSELAAKWRPIPEVSQGPVVASTYVGTEFTAGAALTNIIAMSARAADLVDAQGNAPGLEVGGKYSFAFDIEYDSINGDLGITVLGFNLQYASSAGESESQNDRARINVEPAVVIASLFKTGTEIALTVNDLGSGRSILTWEMAEAVTIASNTWSIQLRARRNNAGTYLSTDSYQTPQSGSKVKIHRATILRTN